MKRDVLVFFMCWWRHGKTCCNPEFPFFYCYYLNVFTPCIISMDWLAFVHLNVWILCNTFDKMCPFFLIQHSNKTKSKSFLFNNKNLKSAVIVRKKKLISTCQSMWKLAKNSCDLWPFCDIVSFEWIIANFFTLTSDTVNIHWCSGCSTPSECHFTPSYDCQDDEGNGDGVF